MIRKLIVLVGAVLLLFGCGNEVDEHTQVETDNDKLSEEFKISEEALNKRDDFISRYNEIINNSEDNKSYIDVEGIEDPEYNEESSIYRQTIHKTEDETILVEYYEDGDIKGYYAVQTSEDSIPVSLSHIVGISLGLDSESYSEAIAETISTSKELNTLVYREEDYRVLMIFTEVDGTNTFITSIDKSDLDISN